jgi:hypothetical protein
VIEGPADHRKDGDQQNRKFFCSKDDRQPASPLARYRLTLPYVRDLASHQLGADRAPLDPEGVGARGNVGKAHLYEQSRPGQ